MTISVQQGNLIVIGNFNVKIIKLLLQNIIRYKAEKIVSENGKI